MTKDEPIADDPFAEDEALDLSGFETAAEKTQTSPALIGLYRLRAAALQMIAKENARQHAAAYERLRLDKELKQSTSFDWTTLKTSQFVPGQVSRRVLGTVTDRPDPPRIKSVFMDSKRIAWEDD
ncbi:MAG: hypothetical protein P8L79_04440 [Rhodospirillaceae bacterium]|jgi:hypothetical protein|nr:hypothetical protein [Rhodospirillaceae bacterium]